MTNSEPKYFEAWILFCLIATVGGFVLGAMVGGVIGLFMGLAHVGLGTIKIVRGIAGFVIALVPCALLGGLRG